MIGRWPKPRSLVTVHSALSAKALSLEVRPPVARLRKVTVPSDTVRMSDGSTLQPFTTRVVRLGTAPQIRFDIEVTAYEGCDQKKMSLSLMPADRMRAVEMLWMVVLFRWKRWNWVVRRSTGGL